MVRNGEKLSNHWVKFYQNLTSSGTGAGPRTVPAWSGSETCQGKVTTCFSPVLPFTGRSNCHFLIKHSFKLVQIIFDMVINFMFFFFKWHAKFFWMLDNVGFLATKMASIRLDTWEVATKWAAFIPPRYLGLPCFAVVLRFGFANKNRLGLGGLGDLSFFISYIFVWIYDDLFDWCFLNWCCFMAWISVWMILCCCQYSHKRHNKSFSLGLWLTPSNVM